MTRDTIRKRLAEKTVGIVGAGGLGSNCACALVRAGLTSLVIADFDVVSESNLDRQFYFRSQIGMPKVDALEANLLAIEPNVRVVKLATRIQPASFVSFYARCDVIVEAVDVDLVKAMLVESALSAFPDKPYVTVSGIAGFGGNRPLRSVRSGLTTLVGDFESEVGPDNPPVAPRVLVAAGLEADAVLEALLDPVAYARGGKR